jgi:hypothetical protein
MNGLGALRTICASPAAALALSGLACLLPDNPYQRWQLVADDGLWRNLRWDYERIHFDNRPVDVAVVGTSGTLLGVSAKRLEQQFAARGVTAHVANLSVLSIGRNIQWTVVDELLKTKSPKVMVIEVGGAPWYHGHPAFRFIAPASAIIAPPAPLLHNYFYDLAYLPARQVKLFAARLFPGLFGLRETFDPKIYNSEQSDYTSGVVHMEEGWDMDMDKEATAESLLSNVRYSGPPSSPSTVERLLQRCCNDGDDRVYTRAIAEEAKARGIRLIFVYVPFYDAAPEVRDRDFLSRYGVVLDNSFLARDPKLFADLRHLNHAGAIENTDRIASAIADLKTSKLDSSAAR